MIAPPWCWASPSATCCCSSPSRPSATGARRQGRSVIDNPTIYALSLAVYCTAWTYFGSVGRAATGGIWFLPIYLGPTLAMLLAWIVVRKMIRIARTYRITSIADFIASRYGKSPLLAALVTLITVVGIVPYIALQLKAVSAGYQAADRRPGAAPRRPPGGATARSSSRWRSPPSPSSSAPATSTSPSATRAWSRPSPSSSLVKLVAFLAVGAFVTWGLFDGMADIWARAAGASPSSPRLLRLDGTGAAGFDYAQWFALTAARPCSRCCCCRGSSR